MSIGYCKGCDNLLNKFRGGRRFAKLVVARKIKGKWVEIKDKEPKGRNERVEKNEKLFFKCISCDLLNEFN